MKRQLRFIPFHINQIKPKQMKTLKVLMIPALLWFGNILKAQSGEIKGLIKDDELNPVIGATVKITQGGYLVGGTTTNAEGKYTYKPLDPGEYEVLVSSMEHSTFRKNKVPVKPNEATYVDIKMKLNTLGDIIIEADFEEPLVDATMIDILSITGKEWNSSVLKTEGVVSAITTLYSGAVTDNNGDFHIHGARANATEYIIDGVKVTEMNGLPNAAIENVSIISGGIPAMYGDLTSGVIVVTTKDYFSGMREKNIAQREYRERQEYKRKQKQEKLEEELRKKEIGAEKAKEKQKEGN
jgi:hypothetical protein